MGTDLVIVLSSDWVGSTATRADVGEETADALQELHDTLLRRVIAAAGGTVVKHSGDGVLATFRSATSALGAAVKIQQDFATYRSSPDAIAPLDIRVGLAAGDVQHQSGDIFGMPVVEAVRLQGAAQPNEILCSDLVRVLSQGRGGFVFEDAGRLQLKGLPARVHAQRVRRADPAVATGAHTVDTRTASVPPAAPGSPTHSARMRFALGVAAIAVVIAGAAIVADRFSRDEPSAAGLERDVPAAQPSAQRTPQAHSIAVLPFANLSPNEADAYFAIGIHEEILDQLTKLRSLRVVARTTVQQYVGTQKAISEIARELNVETVMEGTVRYADGRVLVTTQLIDGATDVQLWSEKYEREFENIFAIQSDIAVKVAQALKAELLPADRERIDRVPTTSLRAYDLYLSATARATRQTAPENQLGIEEVDAATAIDPNFALAWALKADLLSTAPYFDAARAAEHQARGAEAARRAIELDPTLGKAHAALGLALFTFGDWSASEAEFRTALSLNAPLGDMPAYSPLQLSLGNFAYARDILQEARESVPQNSSALALLVMANALLGEWETAKEQYELGTRLFTPWGFGDSLMTYLLVGRNELDAARRIPPSSELDAAMLANLDTPQAALLELRRRYDAADPVTTGGMAPWAAYFGDSALALEAIRAGAKEQGGILMYVWLPQFAEARRVPQFKTLMRDMGVVAYWQEYGWPAVCRPLGADDFECD